MWNVELNKKKIKFITYFRFFIRNLLNNPENRL